MTYGWQPKSERHAVSGRHADRSASDWRGWTLAATVDRLVHNAAIINLNGDNRLKDRPT